MNEGVKERIREDIAGKMRAKQLGALMESVTEVIAQIRAKRELIPEEEREKVVASLRQLGRCAFHLAEDLAERGKT